jgi:hypothetical protein
MAMGNFAKRSAGIAAVVVGLLGAGVAFAAWTSNGTGTGTATATSATPLVISQTASASGLYPTGQVSVPFTVKNNNPYSVTLATAKASGFSVDAAHSGCSVSALSGVDMTPTDVLTAGSTSAAKNMVITMDNTAVDACQGATFTFTITVTGASS